MNPEFSAIIVTHNSAKYLPELLEFVKNDYFKTHGELIVVDNNSNDRSLKIIKEIYAEAKIIANDKNLGFAQANNQGINKSTAQYIFCINPDMVIENNVFEQAIKFMEIHEQCGALSGKVLKYDFTNSQKTTIIDTTGLIIYKNRRVFDRGQGEVDQGQYNKVEEVFGVSAAFACYRKSALENIKFEDEYFDNDFFAYKEDIDLCWRLRLKNWQIHYLPELTVYHGRTTGTLSDKSNIWEIYKNRRQISSFIKSLSYRNQRLMEIKNDFKESRNNAKLQIIFRELVVTIYSLLFEPWFLKARNDINKLRPKILTKRQSLINDKTNFDNVEKWFTPYHFL